MPEYRVSVEKTSRQTGVITIEAASSFAAKEKVKEMMEDTKNPLQTIDDRIEWDDPEYIDFSFQTTGDVEEY